MNLWTGIGIGAVALVVYGLSRLNKASEQMVVEVKGRIHSLDLTGITIAIDANIKNPTSTTINIQYPFVKILYKGSVIASSNLVDQTVRIAPLSQTQINNIMLPIRYLSLTGIGLDLIRKLQTQDKDKKANITIQAQVTSNIYTGLATIPYSSTQDITI